MSHNYKRIILVTDGSGTSHAAEESAFNLARQHEAEVLIVDTVRPPSFVSQLLNSNAEDVFAMISNNKEKYLNELVDRFTNGDIRVSAQVLVGKSSHQIAEIATTWNADLVVRYMKGTSSRHYSRFGNTARNLMRVCPCPLLLVGTNVIETPKVVACVNAEDGSDENEAILKEAEMLAGPQQQLLALYCWKFYGGENLSQHMNDELYLGYVDEAERNYRKLYEHFKEKHDLTAFGDGVEIVNGDPIQAIPEFCERESVEVAVMSSASQDHPIRRLLGSTIEAVLNELPCSLLVVKPLGFESPIATTESVAESANE